MKLSIPTLAFFAATVASVNGQILTNAPTEEGVGSGPYGSPPGCGDDPMMKMLTFQIDVTTNTAQDNNFQILDECTSPAPAIVGEGQVFTGEAGMKTYYFCLHFWRTYTFNWVDNMDPDGDLGQRDSYTLTYNGALVPGSPITLNPDESRSVSSIGYKCPDAAGTWGDPHFKTLSGLGFDFHGGCDLVLVSDPEYNNGLGLDIHVRTTTRYDYSYIESAAIKIGDDVLEVGSFGEHFFNGVEGAGFPAMMGGQFPVNIVDTGRTNHVWEIVLADNKKITVKSFKDFVAVLMPHGMFSAEEETTGILGRFHHEIDFLARDGKSAIADVNEYGQEWQVRDTDPKLFQNTEQFPQYPEKCVMPETTVSERRRLGELKISEAQATAACKTAGRKDIDNCVYDVIATGDLELVSAGAF